ncbi:MAG: LON peptidase substrate-binding domain-containing protein [Phycisphaerales bacterium]|nr:LON peptidase substrate-binding domain-containing protein [Phycisphaerales bacterium]
MSERETVSVDFGKPMPIFPLAQVTLMPHAVLPLQVFEPRYRQMARDILGASGQLALAVYEGEAWKDEDASSPPPPVRPAVCVGQVVQHERLGDGRYNLLVQGVCRAHIVREVPPAEHGRPYRIAHLKPVGVETEEDVMAGERSRLTALFAATSLKDLRHAESIVEYLADEEVPTSAILELVTFNLLPDPELRYRLLEEGNAMRRSAIIRTQLDAIRDLLDRAAPQRAALAKLPKGVFNN